MGNMSTVFKYLEVTNHFVAGYEKNKSASVFVTRVGNMDYEKQ